MMVKVLLYVAIVIQFIAMYYAIRLVRATKYNSIWILFIIGFVVLAAERVLQLVMSYGNHVSVWAMVWMDIVEALEREDVPGLTKTLIQCALKENKGFGQLPYVSRSRPGFLYGVDILE